MQHADSTLTPKGRHRMVLLVEERGLTLEAAAAASSVARSTCRVPGEEARMICERRTRTGWSPRRLADEPDIARPASTVHRVLRRAGCSRMPRPEPPAVIRYEWPCPGNLLHMDVKKLGRFDSPGHAPTGDRRRRSRRVGREYVHPIVDDCSRPAYAEIHDDERASTVAAFTRRAFEWFEGRGIGVGRLMTDNHFSYTKSLALAGLPDGRRVSHLTIRPYTPAPTGRWRDFTRR